MGERTLMIALWVFVCTALGGYCIKHIKEGHPFVAAFDFALLFAHGVEFAKDLVNGVGG